MRGASPSGVEAIGGTRQLAIFKIRDTRGEEKPLERLKCSREARICGA
jgi:hypothetical protein